MSPRPFGSVPGAAGPLLFRSAGKVGRNWVDRAPVISGIMGACYEQPHVASVISSATSQPPE